MKKSNYIITLRSSQGIEVFSSKGELQQIIKKLERKYPMICFQIYEIEK
jgi:hypothetical protein